MREINMVKHIRLFILLITSTVIIFAGGGKISGVVTDGETKQPLPGVNVIVEETSLGAATDIHGEFIILNIPAGSYTLRASYIGYTSYRIQELRVNIDQTTRQNIALSVEVIAGEEVTVIAQRKLVQKDLTASQKIFTSEEILEMPVESFLGVLTTQAGVNTGADGALHIRGGRSNEVGYYIDGISVANPFTTNGLAINISNKALEEMKVVSGAFNAEYGNAMSGIVNIQTKDGGKDYHGSFSVNTGDYISKDTDLYMNIDEVNPFTNRTYEGVLNGPVPLIGNGNRLTFNLSGRYNDYEGYLYGIREHAVGDSANFESDDWYIELGGNNEYVSLNSSKKLNLMGKLTYRLTPRMKLSLQTMHEGRTYKSYTTTGSHNYRYNPDGTSTYQRNNYNYSLRLNHSIAARTFYQANVFISSTDYKRYQFQPIDLSAAKPSEQYFDSTGYVYYLDDPEFGKLYVLQDSKYVPSNRIMGAPDSDTFLFGGSDRVHEYRQSESRGYKFDITSQVTNRHELKTGISTRYDILDERNFEILYDGQRYNIPVILAVNNSPTHDHYENSSVFFSAYIQDKIEYDNMIINAGVRYDSFNPNEDFIANLLEPEGKVLDDDPEIVAAKTKKMVSPRLGISFPITDTGILHFSYGHFYQMPTLRRLYKKEIFGAGAAPEIGYADLKPEKSVIYEFGLQQQFGQMMAIDASIYYKDIRELLALQSISYESPNYGPASYSIYLNKDYGSVQGLTISLTKRYDPVTKISLWLDYSYQKADGNSVADDAFLFSVLTGMEEEKVIVPLLWDQNHILNGTVMFSQPGKWGVTIIGKLAGGWPYTPTIYKANYNAKSNSERKPWTQNINIRAHKTFKIGHLDYVLFAKVYNVFDHRDERYVYNDTGRSGYTYINRSSQEPKIIDHYGEPGVHTWEEYYQRPHYYMAPRSVNIGVSIDF